MPERDDLFQQAMSQGHSAAWDQAWSQAAGYYRQALEITPDHPQALTSLGLAFFELQANEESLKYYLQAAKMTPDDPIPYEKAAELYERMGRAELALSAALQAAELHFKNREVGKAIENWTRVTRIKPDYLPAHTRLALVYERLGQGKAAVAAYLNAASLLQHSRQVDNAVRTVEHALEIVPSDPDARKALAMLRASQPLPKPGRRPSPAARRQEPAAPQPEADGKAGWDPIAESRQKALEDLAGLLFDGAEEASEADTRRGVQAMVRRGGKRSGERNQVMLHLRQAIDFQIQEQTEQAAQELRRAVESGLDHPAAYFDLGLLQTEAEQWEHAVQSLREAARGPDYALSARLLLGQILLKMGSDREAAGEYLEALREADAAVVDSRYAEDLRQLYEPVIEAHSRTADAENQARLSANIAALLLGPGWRDRLREARQQLPVRADGPPVPLAEILTQSSSSQVVESLSAIQRLMAAGHLRSAMEEAFYTLQYAPTYLPLHATMSELLLKQDRPDEAAAKLLVVARTYSIRGERRRALDLYRKVIDLAPMDLSARRSLIDLLCAEGQTEAALQEYLGYAQVTYDLADLGMARQILGEALNLAQRSRLEQTWGVKILHRIADIDLQSLDWRQALLGFEHIRTLQPEDEKARSRLIELNIRLAQEKQAYAELDSYLGLLIEQRRVGQAARFMESLIEENLDRPGIRLRLAEIYRRTGQIQAAIGHLDAAGEALLHAGDRPGAIQAVEAILALNPPNAPDYQRLLSQLRFGEL